MYTMIFINFKSNFTEFLALFPPPMVSLIDIVDPSLVDHPPPPPLPNDTPTAVCHAHDDLGRVGLVWRMGVVHPLPKIGVFSKKYIVYCLLNILHRFQRDKEVSTPHCHVCTPC